MKIVILSLFTSAYQEELFSPFINWYINHSGNPWDAIYSGKLETEFPYSTVMLYVLYPFYYMSQYISDGLPILSNFIKGLPLLLGDIIILYCLVDFSQKYRIRVIYLYSIMPSIIFSTFIHHQLDIIPVSILFLSLLFLFRRQFLYSAILFGLSMSAKVNILLVLPLVSIYIYKKRSFYSATLYFGIAIASYFIVALPYVLSNSFIDLVLFNTKQLILFDSKYNIGDQNLYLSIFTMVIVYSYFLSFRKINNDFLISFIGLLFSAIIFFVEPSPGWYMWLIPFVTLSISKTDDNLRSGYILLFLLNIVYLIYFLLVYKYDHDPIIFIYNVDILSLYKVESKQVASMVFTILEALLICTALYVYKFSLRSNSFYKRRAPFVMGVGGDSGTGKSTLKLLIGKLFSEDLIQIEGDGDHKWERGHEKWMVHTHLDPRANSLYRQSENLIALKNWKDAQRVDYDHSTGSFTDGYIIKPKEFVLISGLHPFYLPVSRSTLDLKIYMEPDECLRRYWKIRRDIEHRGYDIEKIVSQIESRMNDAKKYIYPQKKFADIVISFFPLNDIKLYEYSENIELGLKIQCDANIHLENITDYLNIKYRWDYAEDLKTQVIELFEPPTNIDYLEISKQLVPNLDELVDYKVDFEDGYNGFMQIIILLSISQKMKEGSSL
jgi:uridine kinase